VTVHRGLKQCGVCWQPNCLRIEAGAVPCGDNGVRLRQDDFGVRLDGFRLGGLRGLWFQGAADCIVAKASCFCNLRSNAFGPAHWTGGLFRNLRDNCSLDLEQLCVAPDMRIALLFGQVEPVQVLGNFPKLCGDNERAYGLSAEYQEQD
jgi:hypothetical protein